MFLVTTSAWIRQLKSRGKANEGVLATSVMEMSVFENGLTILPIQGLGKNKILGARQKITFL